MCIGHRRIFSRKTEAQLVFDAPLTSPGLNYDLISGQPVKNGTWKGNAWSFSGTTILSSAGKFTGLNLLNKEGHPLFAPNILGNYTLEYDVYYVGSSHGSLYTMMLGNGDMIGIYNNILLPSHPNYAETNVWHHIRVTCKDLNTKRYINGVLQDDFIAVASNKNSNNELTMTYSIWANGSDGVEIYMKNIKLWNEFID